ncbi:glutathione S-transferase family protein [Brevundimonas lenta]|uniref:Glutathione S-transferase n=1 Tax=Brevundimonas lenta TaxID=424796 RepID=A0A7W6J9W1_9CAUL|nr:glutathione S-transferase family protein [Brevundimonas lenta]MBB4081187.1 glutathione S-transferase [Brevundimonas lenta]
MSLIVWSHPYSAYGQKTAIAFYELGLPFELKLVNGEPAVTEEFGKVSPFAKMPVLIDEAAGATVFESSIVIEYLDRLAGGGTLIPADPVEALEVRFMDRIIDTYVAGPMNRIVFNRLGRAGTPNETAMALEAKELESAWDMLEQRLSDGRTWGAGESFTLADCCAAPILTYARRLVPFGDRPHLRAWHARLMARPSFVRALEEAAPFGDLMPAPPPAD